MARANTLRNAVKTRFYPYAESRGFVRGKSTSLFTVFRRQDGHKWRVFEIQWDKYGSPRFVINFGDAPIGSISLDEREIAMWHCERMGRLQRRKGGWLSCWFQLRKPLKEAMVTLRCRYEPDEVVDQVMAYFPEIEAWWSDGIVGPHLDLLPVAA